jgi:hypothetical protein
VLICFPDLIGLHASVLAGKESFSDARCLTCGDYQHQDHSAYRCSFSWYCSDRLFEEVGKA